MLVWVSILIAAVAVMVAGYTFFMLRNMHIRGNAAASMDAMSNQVLASLKRQIDAVDKRLTNFVDLFLKKENGECVDDVCPAPAPSPDPSYGEAPRDAPHPPPPSSGGFPLAPVLQMVMGSIMKNMSSPTSADDSAATQARPPMAEEVQDAPEEEEAAAVEESGGSTEEVPPEEQGGI